MKDYQPGRYGKLSAVISAKKETQAELQHVVSEHGEKRLRERMSRQKEVLDNLSGSLAWDW